MIVKQKVYLWNLSRIWAQ